MIKLNAYRPEFEEEYWSIAKEKIPKNIQKQIVKSCTKFLPADFFSPEAPSFKKLVLAPFSKMKAAESYIKTVSDKIMEAECFDPASHNIAQVNDLYIYLYKAFEKVADAQRNSVSTRVRIVKKADLTVCPYCNRDYINCRGDKVSGAQLDHFFCRSHYPVFAVSLYNLVPVCGNCNRIKSSKKEEAASPFDETIDWDKEVTFAYQPRNIKSLKIDIISRNPAINSNIEKMRIKEAYQIHETEVLELRDKQRAYSESQKKEFEEVLKKKKVSDERVKEIVFGPPITPADMRKKPLGKMFSDLHKEMKIY